MTYRHTSHLHGDYLDGELPDPQKEAVQKHLAECDDCRADFERLEKLKSTLQQIDVTDAGDDYFNELTSRIAARTAALSVREHSSSPQPHNQAPGQFTLKTLIRLAAAVTFMFAAFYVSDIRQQGDSPGLADTVAQSDIDSGGPAVTDDLTDLQIGINMVGAPSPAEGIPGR